MYPVVILAGGLGTRIKKISKRQPKILLNINKKPFIYYLLNYLISCGVKKVILCTGYGHSNIKKYLENNKFKFKDLDISLSYEGKKRLGTAGAIKIALDKIKTKFIVLYGDNLFDFDLKNLEKIKLKKNKLGLMVIKKNDSHYIKSNLIKIKNKFFYNKNFKKAQFYDFGVMLFKKEIFQKLIKNKKYDLSIVCKKLSDKDQLQYVITKKKLIEIGSIYGIKIFKKKIDEFCKTILERNARNFKKNKY